MAHSHIARVESMLRLLLTLFLKPAANASLHRLHHSLRNRQGTSVVQCARLLPVIIQLGDTTAFSHSTALCLFRAPN